VLGLLLYQLLQVAVRLLLHLLQHLLELLLLLLLLLLVRRLWVEGFTVGSALPTLAAAGDGAAPVWCAAAMCCRPRWSNSGDQWCHA
jgi:hypothetical protein